MRSLSRNLYFGNTLLRNKVRTKTKFYSPGEIIPLQEHESTNFLQPRGLSSEDSFDWAPSRDTQQYVGTEISGNRS